MLKPNNEKNPYAYALLISVFAHGLAFSGIGGRMDMPIWKRLAVVKPQERQVTFELVDDHSRLEPRIKKDVKSNLIDDRSQESKDRVKGNMPGALPRLEGDGKIKTARPVPPATKTAKPTEQVMGKERQDEAIRQEKAEKQTKTEDTTVKEIRKKIKELAELEKQLPDAKEPKKEEPKTSEEKVVKPAQPEAPQKRQTTVTQVRDEKERRLLNNLVSEAQEVGELSLATRENTLVPYLKKMREKIYEKWYPFVGFKFIDINPSKVIVEYKILPNGSIDSIKVTYSEGSPIFKDFCEAAIRTAAPFDPLPIELPEYMRKRCLTICFTFFYG
ncbi:MAG: TonB C-terminal domain-containing protein [Candidatus Omnitrophica bacterium]|nr:TonB C-terminal domain-containing protein [Candidatus Omnitrophota bacterium]